MKTLVYLTVLLIVIANAKPLIENIQHNADARNNAIETMLVSQR